MFVRQSKYDAIRQEKLELHLLYATLMAKYTVLVDRINLKGGEEFLEYASISDNRFSSDELKKMTRLCHPDKHNNKSISVSITQKLNKMIEGMR